MARKQVKIGTVTVIQTSSDWEVTPDDRQQIIQIVGGSIVQDYGHLDSGDVFSLEVVLTAASWEIVKGYWVNRTLVAVQDDGGRTFNNRRIVVKSYKYYSHLFPDYYKVKLELWAV